MVSKQPIDRLVDLIFYKKKISATESSKELNLSLEQIEELSVILKENNIISINHQDNEMFLIAKQLTQKEYVDKVESFARRQEQITDLIKIIEDSIASSKKLKGELFKKLKIFEKDVDRTIRTYNYLILFPSRRENEEAINLKKQTYAEALEIDLELEKTYKELKVLEVQHNELRKLLLEIKQDLIVLDMQSDVEQIDLDKFVNFLNKVELNSQKIEKKKISYLDRINLLKVNIEAISSDLK